MTNESISTRGRARRTQRGPVPPCTAVLLLLLLLCSLSPHSQLARCVSESVTLGLRSTVQVPCRGTTGPSRSELASLQPSRPAPAARGQRTARALGGPSRSVPAARRPFCWPRRARASRMRLRSPSSASSPTSGQSLPRSRAAPYRPERFLRATLDRSRCLIYLLRPHAVVWPRRGARLTLTGRLLKGGACLSSF